MARDTIRKQIDFNRVDVEWFETAYPGASLTHVVSLLLENFRQLHEHDPSELAALAAEQVKELIHGSN